MTISKRRLELTTLDLDIALAYGLGHTIEKTAELAGCSTSTVSNRKAVESVAALIEKIRDWNRRARDEFEEVTKDNLRKRMERYLSKVDQNVGKALDDEEKWWEATKWAAEQQIGKATQTQRIESTHTETITYQLPGEVLSYLQSAMPKQITQSESDIIDGEIVSEREQESSNSSS